MNEDNTLDWYKGPLTKKHIAELREKLGIARGIIEELRELMITHSQSRIGHLHIGIDELDDALNKTSDV
jgi:hypothetical protein